MRLRSRWHRLGPGAPLALLLASIALGLVIGLAPSWREQAGQLHQMARVRADAARSPQPQASSLPQPQPAAILGAGEAQAQARLTALLARAREHSLVPSSAELQRQDSRTGASARWLLNLPLQARYPDLRNFIEAALQADPALSLESLTLRRETTQAERVDAELVWALHLAPAGGPR